MSPCANACSLMCLCACVRVHVFVCVYMPALSTAWHVTSGGHVSFAHFVVWGHLFFVMPCMGFLEQRAAGWEGALAAPELPCP